MEPGHRPAHRRAAPGRQRLQQCLRGGVQPGRQAAGQRGGDGTVRLWNPATGRPTGAPLPTGSGPAGGVEWITFSPNGKLLASADGDNAVRLWDPATGRLGKTLLASARYGAFGVAFSADGKLLATGGADGTVRLWNPATGRPVATIRHQRQVRRASSRIQPQRQAASPRRRRRVRL